MIDYCAAKAALANFSKALSKEVGRARDPGQHGQPRTGRDRPPARAGGVAATVAKATGVDAGTARGPVRRPGGFADRLLHPSRRNPASSCCWASDRTGNVTGSDFVIDGGLIQTL